MVTLLLCVVVVVAITLALPTSYRATATLFVGVTADRDAPLAFDTAVGEQLGRTYTALAANPNVADEARARLPYKVSRPELLASMSFAPVERTQLLQITAEGGSPNEAQLLANTYADAFVARVSRQFARGQTQTRIAVNERAAQPTEVARPNRPLNIGLGSVLSLIVALAATLLAERLRDRIDVSEDQDIVMGQPVLARLPRLATNQVDETVRIPDAFWVLKTNIDVRAEKPPRVIMVTSANPGEGKSTVAAHLAATWLADGERVVLIEADPWGPSLNARFRDANTSRIGLTDYLAGARDFDDVITPQPLLGGLRLDVIWAGPMPPSSSPLFASARFATLLGQLRDQYNRIVIDTSPVLAGAEASVIGSHVDAALCVIDATSTKRSSARAALNQLANARANVIGVAFNRASAQGDYRRSGTHAEGAGVARRGWPREPITTDRLPQRYAARDDDVTVMFRYRWRTP